MPMSRSCINVIRLVLLTTLCGASFQGKTLHAQQETFADQFETPHNFLRDGVAASGWDGFLGAAERETADRIEVADGLLHLQSTRGRYQEAWNPLGPLIYKTVTTDFKATVQVAD